MADRGHEQVVLVADPATGLRAIIAVHSTALGPSLGGVRFWHYASEDSAIRDALRLSEAMSLKASAAGLDQGGGKTVVMMEPGERRNQAMLHALGRAIDELGGRYIAAEDVGATPQDMNWIAEQTPWVTGVDEAQGGSGDPSPVTAIGVFAGIRAALREADGNPYVASRSVAIQGAGHVGSHLARLLVEAGATVTVSDIDPERPARLAAELGVGTAGGDEILELECDVLAPCALGEVLNAQTVPRLRCRVIAGAANNQLATLEDGDALAARGVVYAPDYVVNAGGIINIAEEFTGYDRARAEARTRAIEETTTRIFALARERGLSPARAAELYARERIEREGRGRWAPGSPAAWTDGSPLRSLRAG
jgi:leucine dehydrogenase